MRRRTPAISRLARIVAALAVLGCSSCRQDTHAGPRGGPPDSQAARRAVEIALAEWRDAPPLDLTTPTIRPVMFVDQRRQPGQRLRDFAVLGESEMDGCRRFRVRLSLADPDESFLVDYYVFGRGPIWVYRAEDFDMIMHMDKSMMGVPGAAEGETGTAPPAGSE